jgi:hypothetical protein
LGRVADLPHIHERYNRFTVVKDLITCTNLAG